MPRISPYQNDAQSVGIGDLTIENRVDSVEMFGSLSLTKDKAGLKLAREFKAIVDATVAALEAEKNLPDKIETIAPKKKKNPFSWRRCLRHRILRLVSAFTPRLMRIREKRPWRGIVSFKYAIQ